MAQTNSEVIDACLIAACIKAAATHDWGFSASDAQADRIIEYARELYKCATVKPWEKGS